VAVLFLVGEHDVRDEAGDGGQVGVLGAADPDQLRIGRPGRQSVLMDSRLLFSSRHCLDNDGVEPVPLRRVQSRCGHQLGCPNYALNVTS